jgi:dUTP pyrophosphatase
VSSLSIAVKRVRANDDLPLPAYASNGSAGMDLLADVLDEIRLGAGERVLISTGIALQLPPGYEAQIRPRSGLALHHGITLLNAPGTIDADYRGEVCVILINLGHETYTVRRGDRIAQMVVGPVIRATLHSVGSLEESERGTGGFGHTGSR